MSRPRTARQASRKQPLPAMASATEPMRPHRRGRSSPFSAAQLRARQHRTARSRVRHLLGELAKLRGALEPLYYELASDGRI